MATPDYNSYCDQFWGWPEETDCSAFFGGATNVVVGTNPPYQISDFVQIFPKWGTSTQAVALATLANGGIGFAVNDQANVIQPDASGCVVTVTAIGASGAVTGLAVSQSGQGYSVAQGLATAAIAPSGGSGLTVNVTLISPSNLIIPQSVLQAFINLALASLQQQRWLEWWPMGMAWFVDHFATLWLTSNGNTGTTAAAVARSGLALGVIVSQSAGDVSKSIEPPDLHGFSASWGLTASGQQFVDTARCIGSGPMLIW